MPTRGFSYNFWINPFRPLSDHHRRSRKRARHPIGVIQEASGQKCGARGRVGRWPVSHRRCHLHAQSRAWWSISSLMSPLGWGSIVSYTVLFGFLFSINGFLWGCWTEFLSFYTCGLILWYYLGLLEFFVIMMNKRLLCLAIAIRQGIWSVIAGNFKIRT